LSGAWPVPFWYSEHCLNVILMAKMPWPAYKLCVFVCIILEYILKSTLYLLKYI